MELARLTTVQEYLQLLTCSRELDLDPAMLAFTDEPGPEILWQDLAATGTVPLKPAFSKTGEGKWKLKRTMKFQARRRPQDSFP